MPPRNRPHYNRDPDSDPQPSDSGSEYEDSTSDSSSDSSYSRDLSSSSGDKSDPAGEVAPSGPLRSAPHAHSTRATFATPSQRGAKRATTGAAAQAGDASLFDSNFNDKDLNRTLFQGNLHPPEF
ncbi:hypothetical protein ANO14919_053980 [Xylariales sp. No.14919]|nr:hypothetical protein ANO14919_053980 [Xylariales sp. No.14919]